MHTHLQPGKKVSVWAWIRLMIAILGAMALILLVLLRLSFHEVTLENVVVINGHVASYQSNSAGGMMIRMSEYKNVFIVNPVDMRFFDQQKFIGEVHSGSQLYITILKSANKFINEQNRQLGVLELRADSRIYLPLPAVVAARK